jgi:hypothetical protein
MHASYMGPEGDTGRSEKALSSGLKKKVKKANGR